MIMPRLGRCSLLAAVIVLLAIAHVSVGHNDTHILQLTGKRNISNNSQGECRNRSTEEFPKDIFTEKQREQGAVLLHLLMAFYCFTLLAYVCNDYFLPSVDCICTDLNLSQDVAGATFMAMATSVPELFMNVIGTFLTETDMGVGAVVGSAVFNTLGVAACSGLATKKIIQVAWWPLTRDCSIYIVVLCVLTVVVWDELIMWYEAGVLLLLYVIYFVLMYANPRLHKAADKLVNWISGSDQVLNILDMKPENNHLEVMTGTYRPHAGSQLVAKLPSKQKEDTEALPTISSCPLALPKGSFLIKLWWLYTLPIKSALFVTVPDCRQKQIRKLYPLTFLMCVVWIAATSYIVAWMVTVIGDTFEIPDSVLGLTLLAAGNSLPETIGSIIMTRQGEGSMGISNSLGANTLDVLLCLGLPWFIKSLMTGKPITIISSALAYNCLGLLGLIILFFIIMSLFRFQLGWRLGSTCLILYTIYVVLAVLIELNIFFYVNPPVCVQTI